MKRIALLISVAAALGLAASASAAAPVIVTVEVNQTTPVPNVACTAYGYSFDTLSTFDVVRRSIMFTDDSAISSKRSGTSTSPARSTGRTTCPRRSRTPERGHAHSM